MGGDFGGATGRLTGGELVAPNKKTRRLRLHPTPRLRLDPPRRGGGFSSQQHPRAAAGSPEGGNKIDDASHAPSGRLAERESDGAIKERRTGHVPTAGDPEPCATGRRNSRRAIRPARGTRVGWRKQKSKARSGRVPRRGVFAMSSLGTGPLRDRPRTGFRTGHLMKRGAPHTGFSPRADLPSALSASRACRERVGLPHPSFARRLARCPCRMGEGIMRGVAIPRISFLWLRGVRCSAPGGRLAERESPGAIKRQRGVKCLLGPKAAQASRVHVLLRVRSKARGLGRPRASRPCRPSARSNTQSSPSLICRWFSLAPSQ